MKRAPRYFAAHELDLLGHPEQWRLVGSGLVRSQASLRSVDRKRREWSPAHAHGHPHREFLVTLDGRGTYALDGKIYTCRPGTIFFFDTSEPHDNGYPPDAPDARHLWIDMTEGGFFFFLLTLKAGAQRTFRPAHHHISFIDLGVSALGLFLGDGLVREDDRAGRQLRIHALLQLIVAEIVRRDGQASPPVVVSRKESQKEAMRIVQRHLQDTAGKGATLEGVARLAGYSKYHFLRLFNQHIGYSVHDYINQCRLRRVHEALRRHCSHKQIGSDLGFSCPAAFSRWFRQMKQG